MENIDPHALKAIISLRRPGKPDFLNKIVKLLKSEPPEYIAALQQGLDMGDLNAVRSAAQTLKSNGGRVGGSLLWECSRDPGTAASNGNLAECTVPGDGVDALGIDARFESSIAELTLQVSRPV